MRSLDDRDEIGTAMAVSAATARVEGEGKRERETNEFVGLVDLSGFQPDREGPGEKGREAA